ncbi:TetR/AcrR family transcriptional regulator [Erythrobacter mangrovi]|uniref:TetR/AcrR family transcriptional regulator n=1 Tax=Erythrobacter mangrovi TaxID=2739433 RepID=A0A7D3XJP1_9SPHN|nr:TetR/AcrR family transcriptional regulator [Erythrobacter mangrovi]QKG72199.1 TetR/AcrR family transcriptional regulator [Erythrobacter mangrovi]
MEARRDEQDRGEQILAAAERLILETGTPSISLNEIAAQVGVSRSLLYTYYDGVPQIVDALFRRHTQRLEQLIDARLSGASGFRERMVALFGAYLENLVEHGPLALIVLRERNQDSPLSEESSRLFRRNLRGMARDVSKELKLNPREAFVFLELLAAIPESLSRMVRDGQIRIEVALATCARLVSEAVQAMSIEKA